jgi:outer membrane protein TolC
MTGTTQTTDRQSPGPLAAAGAVVFTAALTVMALGLTAGCFHQGGTRAALNQTAVNAALQAPPLDSIKIAAARLDHPLLKPMLIDGRDGFSPDEIAVMAVIVSPQLRALRDQRGVAQAQVLQAGILPNPQLGYSLEQLHGDNAPGLINGRSLGLSWDFTSLLGRQDRIDSARSGAEALDLSIAWQEWQTAQDARLRAFRLLALRTRLPLVREIEAALADTLAAVKSGAALGHKTALDVTTTTEAWIAAQSSRLTAEQDYVSERAALNIVLGQPADTEIALKAAAVFPELSPDDALASLLPGLEQRRLDLVALALGYESQDASLRAAVKAQFPRIGLSLGKANDTSDVRTRNYGVTIDLPLFDRNQGNIALARATRQQLFDEYVARVAEARAEVVLILGRLAAARTQLDADNAALPELAHLVASYEKALQTRNADVPAYRDARSLLAARRLEQNILQQQMLELGVALELATGRPLLNHRPSN